MASRSIFLIILLFASAVHAGTSYYIGSTAVATYGADPGFANYAAFRTAYPTLSTGDDLYFEKGESHTFTVGYPHVYVDWTGTSGDRVIIGAWGSGTDPIIDGQDVYPSGPSKIPCLKKPEWPCWDGLLKVNNVDYVTVENLNVKNAEGVGIQFIDSDHFILQDCAVSNIFRLAGHFKRCSYGTVEDNEFSDFGRRMLETDNDNTSGGVATYFCDNVTMTGNLAEHTRAECFGIYQGSSDCIVTKNTSRDCKVGVYVGRSSNIEVTHNLVVRGSDDISPNKGIGIGVTEEEPIRSGTTGMLDNVLVAGNVVIGTEIGFWGAVQNDYVSPYFGQTDWTNIKILNNTFICKRTARLSNRYYLDAAATTGSEFKGNISWASEAQYIDVIGNFSGMEFGPNMWNTQTIYAHQNDIIAVPDFETAGRFTNTPSDEILISDVAFEDGSPGVEDGIDMSAEITQLFLDTDTDARTATLSTVSTWDMGAVDFQGAPSPPANEEICNDGGVDNDGDGDADCADSDCVTAEEYCLSSETGTYGDSIDACDDGIDNDGDGLIDCYSGIPETTCSCASPVSNNWPLIKGGVWR